MKRGEVWTVAGGSDYAGKPRPAVILQDDAFDATLSVTICPFTTSQTEAPSLRPVVQPSDQNGLRIERRLMVDKITTVSRTKVQSRVGRLSAGDLNRLDRSVLVFLGLTSSIGR